MPVTVTPYVNLNGTAREALVDAYVNAAGAVVSALTALAETAPHPRDYQTAPAGRYELARAEHEARVNALASVREDLTALAEAVSDSN
jgi:hypothetical protein